MENIFNLFKNIYGLIAGSYVLEYITSSKTTYHNDIDVYINKEKLDAFFELYTKIDRLEIERNNKKYNITDI